MVIVEVVVSIDGGGWDGVDLMVVIVSCGVDGGGGGCEWCW